MCKDRPALGVVADTDEEELTGLRELVKFLRQDVHTQQVQVEELRKIATEAFMKLSQLESKYQALLGRLTDVREKLVGRQVGPPFTDIEANRAVVEWLDYILTGPVR